MAVRSALPWPLRWLVGALMLGFSAAVTLWAFEVGKGIAGLDSGATQELHALREEVALLRADREKALSVANTSGSLLITEKAAQEKMGSQIRQLEVDNRSLRDDLGFFERLLPAGGGEAAAIRSLQAEMLSSTQLKWQVLVIQPAKNAPNFNGSLELIASALWQTSPGRWPCQWVRTGCSSSNTGVWKACSMCHRLSW